MKGIPFNTDDPEVSGPDIFRKLVPIEAHEASSLYRYVTSVSCVILPSHYLLITLSGHVLYSFMAIYAVLTLTRKQ